ncbi:MAG: isoaspartyl peptidase/L-asparaginase, partial [Blastocatellia bacterium]
AGYGANQFASEMKVEFAPDEYFFTEHRWQQLQKAIATGKVHLDHSDKSSPPYEGWVAEGRGGSLSEPGDVATGSSVNRKSNIANRKSLGTVGAVACDASGRLAAATSTGGMTNKKFGRVGDTALIGAGTYADESVAVSCTGHGEFFMLAATAHDLAARMKYKGLNLEAAAQETIAHLTTLGGEGGLIAVDPLGNTTLSFNSEGMYRAWMVDAVPMIEIYEAVADLEI